MWETMFFFNTKKSSQKRNSVGTADSEMEDDIRVVTVKDGRGEFVIFFFRKHSAKYCA